ncbi:hypothetical protein Hanom_Chr10g00923671 [Helianthus anomalus]
MVVILFRLQCSGIHLTVGHIKKSSSKTTTTSSSPENNPHRPEKTARAKT